MNVDGQYQLVFGDGSNMGILRNGEVDLVFTGPPYFSDATEELLKRPIREQSELARVKRELTSFALGLRPVYEEIRRVLRPGGVLVTQTKDIYYGGVFISLVALHREMAEATGLNLLSRVCWHKSSSRSESKEFIDNPVVGTFRSNHFEEICIFSDMPRDEKPHRLVELDASELKKSVSPLWDIEPSSSQGWHPHKTPMELAHRIIALFSDPNDLVVDPFCGSGTTLQVAVEMGRRAVGYEIQEHYAKLADDSLLRSISHKGKPAS